MLESVFIIILAGCTDDGLTCSPLRATTVFAQDVAACERMLDEELRNETAPWPVYSGVCRPVTGENELLVAEAR